MINRKPLIDGLSDQGAKPTERPQGGIELRDVMFAYPSRPNIQGPCSITYLPSILSYPSLSSTLENVFYSSLKKTLRPTTIRLPTIPVCNGYNLAIKPGESLALCGPSGAGKSTIMNLLLRFYDPQEGLVMLDGKDIRQLNVRWLRNSMGYVGQEPVLFSGTIADNIAYGVDRSVDTDTDPTTLQHRIEAAATQANAHDFIMAFPQGGTAAARIIPPTHSRNSPCQIPLFNAHNTPSQILCQMPCLIRWNCCCPNYTTHSLTQFTLSNTPV